AWKDIVPPYMPRNMRYEKISPTGPAALRWDLPITAPDGDSASRYAVYRFDHTPALPGELADARNMLAVVGERQYVPPTPPPGGPYSYVVTALDRNYNESEPSSVLPLGAPGVPVLASPANGTTAIAESVLVVWKNSLLASSYHLQGSVDSTFASGFFVNDSTITDTSKIVRGYPGQVRAYWRVRARNASGSSAFSEVYWFVPGMPALATLASPPDVAVDQPVVVPFRWNRAQAASSYRLQLALNATFTPAVFDTAGVVDTSIVSPALDYYKIYFWRVKAKNAIGEADWTAYYRFRTVQVSAVEKGEGPPADYALSQNYPNPFNPVTSIRFAVPRSGRVLLTVYDVLGQEQATLVDDELSAGAYTVSWDASRVASGVYFCRMRAGDFVATKRMLLLR
ncbi:MAG: T9SS type A sorting domain-containing protein, partial [Candidatus Peregrinibacteria bacterium]